MAKRAILSVNELLKQLREGKLLPVYLICGDDTYSIDNTIEKIKKNAMQHIKSEFDIEIIDAERGGDVSTIIDLATTFPFGGNKKLIIVKNFEVFNDKKILKEYIDAPSDFTILVLINRTKLSDYSKEPYLSLLKKGFLFETKQETGEELVDWLEDKIKKFDLNLTKNDLYTIIEMVGENKSLIENQINKILDFSMNKKGIDIEDIKKIISSTKKYSIFDLQDAIGRGDKSKALEICYNLLDNGEELIVIINMLVKFILTIAQILEMVKLNMNDNEAAKKLQVSWYYYINCKKANYLFSDLRLLNASRALLDADTKVKTTSTDAKTILTMLIANIIH